MLRLLFLLVLLTVAALADGPTDQQILTILNAGRPTKQQLTTKDVRILRPEGLDGVTLVGFLTGSRGALLGVVFLDGQKMLPADACRALLGKLGWEKASPAERQKLALTWVEKAQLAFAEQLVEEKNADFQAKDAPKFEPPRLESTAAGGVRVQAWIKEDSGTTSGTNYRKSIYLFDADGRLARARQLDQYFVPSR